MAVYRGKYVLRGLGRISPEMEADLDLAYGACMELKDAFPCEMCGKCCHQPNIVILPEEVDRISAAAGIPLHVFMKENVIRTSDGRMLFKKTGPCVFLREDMRCGVWNDRPEICRDFPYGVSMLMSRVYLAIVDESADVIELTGYMDSSWPCTGAIRSSISEKVDRAREVRRKRTGAV
ncbi:MAG: YkgJ family cysteine cluster protein [Candidatus Methanoplasma sp.]|jgi:Fe-S-cluster containining protein|nr:YkgJ family cysteine cluster protein [Candidatus Methanoplasma sp.]